MNVQIDLTTHLRSPKFDFPYFLYILTQVIQVLELC